MSGFVNRGLNTVRNQRQRRLQLVYAIARKPRCELTTPLVITVAVIKLLFSIRVLRISRQTQLTYT